MSKRNTKTSQQKSALRQRLADLAHGAYGAHTPLQVDGEEFGGMASEMGLDAFGRWLGAIKNVLIEDNQAYLIEPHNFEHYDTMGGATEFLWINGVRA